MAQLTTRRRGFSDHDALSETNLSQQPACGNDEYSVEARRLIAAECGRPDVPVHFVGGGTLANLIICSAVLRSHEAVVSAASGHVAMRETGAIEATGHKIITMPSADGKLTPPDVDAAIAANSVFPHMARPRLVYVSNATEFGTVYTRDELAALQEVCRAHELLLMIDGARLGVALASEHAGAMTLAAMTELVADGVVAAGFELAAKTESNQVFALLPNAVIETLQKQFSFHGWEPRPDDQSVVRLVTSWATDPDQIERFAMALARLAR